MIKAAYPKDSAVMSIDTEIPTGFALPNRLSSTSLKNTKIPSLYFFFFACLFLRKHLKVLVICVCGGETLDILLWL